MYAEARLPILSRNVSLFQTVGNTVHYHIGAYVYFVLAIQYRKPF